MVERRVEAVKKCDRGMGGRRGSGGGRKEWSVILEWAKVVRRDGGRVEC